MAVTVQAAAAGPACSYLVEMEEFLALTEVPSDLVKDTIQKLVSEGVTAAMIVEGHVTRGELAEIQINPTVLDALPKAIEAWNRKVRYRELGFRLLIVTFLTQIISLYILLQDTFSG